jgi:hypothetical protein
MNFFSEYIRIGKLKPIAKLFVLFISIFIIFNMMLIWNIIISPCYSANEFNNYFAMKIALSLDIFRLKGVILAFFDSICFCH